MFHESIKDQAMQETMGGQIIIQVDVFGLSNVVAKIKKNIRLQTPDLPTCQAQTKKLFYNRPLIQSDQNTTATPTDLSCQKYNQRF